MIETKTDTPQPAEPQKQPGSPQPLTLPAVSDGFDFGSFFIGVFVVTLLITGAVYGYRYLLLERTLNEQTQQIAQLNNELASDEALSTLEKQVNEIATGLDLIQPILDDPIRYGELFWTLRKVTEKSVRWRSMGLNEAKQISLTGDAAGWGNVARQLAALKENEKFSDVQLSSSSVQESEDGFAINFSVLANVNTDKLVPPTTP